MPDAVCRMLTLWCTLVVACPIGTNLGLLHLLWMLASGRLLGARGALFPGLADCGRSVPATRRAWAALGQGDWTSGQFIGRGPGWRRGKASGRPTRIVAIGPARSTVPGAGARGFAAAHPLPRRGRQGAPDHPARPHRRGRRRRSAAPGSAACLRPRRPISRRDSGDSGVPLPRPPHPRPLPTQPASPQTGSLTDSTKVLQ